MDKLKSRKFWVWVSMLVVLITGIVITKTLTAEMLNMFTVVSAIYIGGNTAQKFIKR